MGPNMKQDIEKFQQAILNAEYTISTEQLQQIDNLESTLESVNLQLERYVSQIDKYDYILAIASGVLCGVIDSMFVGSLSVTADDIILSHKQVNGFIEQYAKRNGWNGDGRLKSAVAFLEDKYPVAQDSIFKGNAMIPVNIVEITTVAAIPKTYLYHTPSNHSLPFVNRYHPVAIVAIIKTIV